MTTVLNGKSYFRSTHEKQTAAVLRDVGMTLTFHPGEKAEIDFVMSGQSALAELENELFVAGLVHFEDVLSGSLYSAGPDVKIVINGKEAGQSGYLLEGQKLRAKSTIHESKAEIRAQWRPSLRER